MPYNDTAGDEAGVILPLAIAAFSHCCANFLSGIAIGKDFWFGE
ncbi:MAG: hypothetical protein V8T07_00540 [Muribaculaceae bacterium]